MAPPMSRILVVQFILLYAAILPVYSDNPPSITLSPISPTPTQCETFTFHWTGGTPPFFVSLIQQGGLGQRHLGPTNDSFRSWDSDFPALTSLKAQVMGSDSESEPSIFLVQRGLKTDCLGPPSLVPTVSPTSNTAASSTDSIGNVSSAATSDAGPSLPTSLTTSPAPTQMSPSSVPSDATVLSQKGAQTSAARSSSRPGLPSQASTPNPATATVISQPSAHASGIASWDTSLPSSPPPGLASVITSPASPLPQQSTSHGPSNRGRVAGIIVGCLVAALLAALALILLRKRRRARGRSRVTSMATLDTLAFTATTWSDLSLPKPGKPLGSNKGISEWNADLFARERPRKSQNAPPASFGPLLHPQPPFRKGPRITSLSTIAEASAESSLPSPVESDESASTAQNLHSYPPLVPQTLPTSGRSLREHGYSPAVPPAVQVPVNPFRARLLAARSRGTWAGNDDLGDPDPFR